MADLADLPQALLVFEIRDYFDVAAARTQGVADQLEVRGALYEGRRHEVHGLGGAELQQVVKCLFATARASPPSRLVSCTFYARPSSRCS